MARFPVVNKKIASGFKPAGRPNHFGLDLAGAAGTAVGAPEAGEVQVVFGAGSDATRADNTPVDDDKRFTGYGPAGVLLKGESGRFHLLAHLDPQGWGSVGSPAFNRPSIDSPADVVETPSPGDSVVEGQQLGRMPTHVGASGPHTHWEVRTNPIDNPTTRELNTVDPSIWVNDPSTTSTITTRPKTSDVPWYVWVIVGYFLIKKSR